MADQVITNEVDSSKPVRKCAWCGVDISHMSSRAIYCANVCKRRSYRESTRNWVKTCFMCGDSFRIDGPRSWKKSVCSHECWKAWDRIKHAKKSARPLSLMGPLLPMHCQECKSPFISWNGRPGYCSNACKSRSWANSLTGRDYKLRFAETGWSREWRRRRAAERALSMLLMPVHKLESN